TGVDDALLDGTQTYDITVSVSAGSDPLFTGLAPQLVSVENLDDDLVVATISTTSDTATELGVTSGSFTIGLDLVNNTGSDIVVSYSIDGTAINGTDYTELSGSVVIANGQQEVTTLVTPNNDTLTEEDETVIITLEPGAGYTVGSPDTVTITIESEDNVPPDGYSVTINEDVINLTNVGDVGFTISGIPLLSFY